MIDILMSTYNGAEFIGPQIDSILGQRSAELRLMIRDDGSSDGTGAIIESYAASDGRVAAISDELGNLGVRHAFVRLLELSDAPYFGFADQDDIWLPEKIARSLVKLSEMERAYGEDVPLLVFTDLCVVDRELNVLDPSFWHYQRLDPEICRDWRDLLAQNVVTGSTIVANAAARLASLPFVLDEMLHDHWVAVNTARAGHIDFISEPLVQYRQHDSNAEGARRAGASYLTGNLSKLMRRMPTYARAAGNFGGVTAGELFLRKVRLNVRRFVGNRR